MLEVGLWEGSVVTSGQCLAGNACTLCANSVVLMGGQPLPATATGPHAQPFRVVVNLEPGDRGAVSGQGDSVLVHEAEAAPVCYPLDAVCHTRESAMNAAGTPVVDALLEGIDALLLCCGGVAVAQQAALFGSSAEQPGTAAWVSRALVRRLGSNRSPTPTLALALSVTLTRCAARFSRGCTASPATRQPTGSFGGTRCYSLLKVPPW